MGKLIHSFSIYILLSELDEIDKLQHWYLLVEGPTFLFEETHCVDVT